MKIKYLYNSFKKANETGVLSSYLFYLQLKSIDKGFLKGGAIKQIKAHLDYSAASISTQLKKCVQLGYISLYKHDSNKEWKYVLTSYRKVWNKLNFRFSPGYIERFKFEFIDLSTIKSKAELKAMIFNLELRRNKEKQDYKANIEPVLKEKEQKIKNTTRMIQYHSETINKIKSEKVKERKKAALIRLDNLKQSLEEIPCEGNERPIENKISCKKAASLMGYKTSMTTVNLSKKATQMQLLSKKSSKSLVATGISRIEFRNPAFDNCLWIYGKIYKQECSTFLFR